MMPEARVAAPVTPLEAQRLSRELYGLQVSARSLPGEYDDNFHVVAADGKSFVLKILHPARDREFIELQCSALEHLARRAPQLALPRVVRTRTDEPFSCTTIGDGGSRFVWLLTYVPGTPLAGVRPHTSELLESVGCLLGEMDAALVDFSHPAAHRELKWDLSRAAWIRSYLHCIPDPPGRDLVNQFVTLYESEVVPKLPRLRRSVIYGDANDHNVLVGPPWPQPRKAVSVIDFGDMHHGLFVAEPATAAAYAILAQKDVLSAAASIVRGFHSGFALEEGELETLYALIGMRLAVSVTNSAHRKTLHPNDSYVTVSEAPAWEALEQWGRIHPRFALYVFRNACGFTPVPESGKITAWLAAQSATAGPILEADLRSSSSLVFDLSVSSRFLGADPKAAECATLTRRVFEEMRHAKAAVGIGRYDEPRLLYSSPLFGASANPVEERRTVHLGLDLFVEAGSAVHAPLEGIVHALANNAAALDYGPVVILRHSTDEGQGFFTLYGHLSSEVLTQIHAGQKISRGQQLARVGASNENGGWPPHLHFQIILDLLDRGSDFPGVAAASQCAIWKILSPDPNLLLGIPPERFPPADPPANETLAARLKLLGPNLSISYEKPLKIVRGWMQYLYDETGRAYLDVYNNVPLVGHSHPRVVRAVQEQMALLNTNTRYLHDAVVRYAERLTRRMPAPLRVCYFVNSGSEANELALRLARAQTRREDVIVLEHAYHGHTTTLIDVSPYKFDGPGGSGRKPWVHVAQLPDDYRGPYRRDEVDAGPKYARHVADIVGQLRSEGRGVAAFLAETLPSVAGQIVFPRNYLAEVYRHVRAAGGVCIADEVQVGFGRLGTHFWGFETQGAGPDIVVLGKPIGNAFPLAAVITTPEIAASFDNGMEFFSTFGGNPVACAAGLAVLDVLEEEKLQERALRVGRYWTEGLRALAGRYPLIGDVRGLGLFLGLDLVLDRNTRAPATPQASYVVNRLRQSGILAGTDGPHHNVIKLRPPLIFSERDADLFNDALAAILQEDAAQPGPGDALR